MGLGRGLRGDKKETGMKIKYIEYVTDFNPVKTGIYACRIPANFDKFCDDKFLMWYNNGWWYLNSSIQYRGKVVGWLGPLPRLNQDD